MIRISRDSPAGEMCGPGKGWPSQEAERAGGCLRSWPPPTIAVLVIRGAARNCGPLLWSSPLLIASSFARNLITTVIGRMATEVILSG